MSPLEKLRLPEQPPMKKLGVYDRSKNPTFESHDPGLMKDPVTGWYLSYCTDSKPKQGIPLRRSRDLVHWEDVDTVLDEASIEQAKQNGNRKPTPSFWAPLWNTPTGNIGCIIPPPVPLAAAKAKSGWR